MADLQFAIPALAALVGLSALFSGLEVALVSLERGQLRRLVNEKRSGVHSLAKLKSNPKRMLITILLGVNLANIGAAAVATDVAIASFGNLGLGIATGIMTLILLVFLVILLPRHIVMLMQKRYRLGLRKCFWQYNTYCIR
jgi:Mg2+/Co2+ transporter CorB